MLANSEKLDLAWQKFHRSISKSVTEGVEPWKSQNRFMVERRVPAPSKRARSTQKLKRRISEANKATAWVSTSNPKIRASEGTGPSLAAFSERNRPYTNSLWQGKTAHQIRMW